MNYREFQKSFSTKNATIAYLIEKKFPCKKYMCHAAAALAAEFIISITTTTILLQPLQIGDFSALIFASI
jgi:hypothetical protein